MRRRDPTSEPLEVTQFVGDVGVRIRVMRLARGLTQKDLAERADISRLTLMAIEAGSFGSRFADVARLLWVLDDVSLQASLATAAQDPAYQDAVRGNLPRFKSRKKDLE
ncbi:helix-turn-helix transcriptional regulator [Roseateles sp.]|uniref:helix-turn-helix transcriptional regulator n=1 Tax=Roseateles sp. TaxID=1971397 RepID=UPI0025E07E14|nr:helix-turn-helix transcriptional regulator [Roseateles sp.]